MILDNGRVYTMMMEMSVSLQPWTVVFDLGGVLIDWNPRYLYRKLFPGDEAGMEHFLAHVCTSEWNIRQDGGRPFAEAYAELHALHPDKRPLIEAWAARFDEMMSGPVAGSVEILSELRARGTPLYALTNWSNETFPFALRRFEFLGWFQHIVVSGQLKLTKPDPRIYQHLLDGQQLEAARTIFIDDAKHNVEGANALGIRGLHFTTPAALRGELSALGLL